MSNINEIDINEMVVCYLGTEMKTTKTMPLLKDKITPLPPYPLFFVNIVINITSHTWILKQHNPVWQNKNHSIFNIPLGSRVIKLPVTFHVNFNILSWRFQASWYLGMRHPRIWQHHGMKTLSILSSLCFPHSPVDSPHKGPVMWSFYVFLVVSLNEMLNKQSMCQWLLMPWSSL